jgi:DNA-binding NarL/FixJ family response regulator
MRDGMALNIPTHESWRRPPGSKSTAPPLEPSPREPRDPAFAARLKTLSRQQLATLRCRCEQHGNAEAARACFVSEQTVKNHLTAVYWKLGLSKKGSGKRRMFSARACYLLGRYDADLDGEAWV